MSNNIEQKYQNLRAYLIDHFGETCPAYKEIDCLHHFNFDSQSCLTCARVLAMVDKIERGE